MQFPQPQPCGDVRLLHQCRKSYWLDHRSSSDAWQAGLSRARLLLSRGLVHTIQLKARDLPSLVDSTGEAGIDASVSAIEVIGGDGAGDVGE